MTKCLREKRERSNRMKITATNVDCETKNTAKKNGKKKRCRQRKQKREKKKKIVREFLVNKLSWKPSRWWEKKNIGKTGEQWRQKKYIENDRRSRSGKNQTKRAIEERNKNRFTFLSHSDIETVNLWAELNLSVHLSYGALFDSNIIYSF